MVDKFIARKGTLSVEGLDAYINDLPDKYVPIGIVMAITGLGRSTIFEKARLGQFPKQKKFFTKTSRWSLAEVMAWIHALPEGPYGRENYN